MKAILALSGILIANVFAFGTVWAAPQNPPSAPVTVVNTTANPVPVTITNSPAPDTPFQASLCYNAGDTYTCAGWPSSLTVPAGKRLVVEFVSGGCRVDGTTGTIESVILRTYVGPVPPVVHHMTLTPVSPPVQTENKYTFTQQTRIYADPETEVVFSPVSSTMEPHRCFVTISGHLVTAP